MPMFTNPYVRAIGGGLVTALAVASPLAGDGISLADGLAIGAAFLTGAGFTAAPSGRDRSDVD